MPEAISPKTGGKTDPENRNIVSRIVAIVQNGSMLIPRVRNYPIAAKLIAALLGVTLTIALVITFSMTNFTRNFQRETIGRQYNSLAEAKALALGNLISQQVDGLSLLALDQLLLDEITKSNERYSGDPDGENIAIELLDKRWRRAVWAGNLTDPLIQEVVSLSPVALELDNYRRDLPALLELVVVNDSGALLGATDILPFYDHSDEIWWQLSYKGGRGGIYIGAPEADPGNGETSISIAVPVRDRLTQKAIGAVRAIYSLRDLNQLLFAERIGESGAIDLVLPGSPPRVVRPAGLEAIDPETLSKLRATSEDIYAQFDYRGGMSLVSQAWVESISGNPSVNDVVENLRWVLVVHQPSHEVLAPVVVQGRNTFFLATGLLILLTALGAWMAKLMTNPIVRLRDIAEQLGAGALGTRAIVENQDEVGALAEAFNDMAVQLQSILQDLELRVEERSRVIELSANVSRRLSTIMDTDRLVSEVVDLLQAAFGYYYVQIYLADEKTGDLLMVGGSGETGKLLLESGYQLGKGMGLVGRAAETGMVVLVSNVRNDPGYLPNPLLPDTKAEITVPIIRGEQVKGVLDVQHNEVDGLGELDLYALQSISNQVATALDNAHQYIQAQRRAGQEAFLSETMQQVQSTQSVSEALQVVACKLAENFTLRTRARLSVAHSSAQRDNSGLRE